MKRYQLRYKGQIAFVTNVRSKAQSRAFQLIKDKGWDATLVEVKDTTLLEVK